jgi:3-methyladenine DNA glycosylase AlkC
MAEPLKHFFDARRVEGLAAMLRAVHPAFPGARFVAEASEGLEALELMPRARHIAQALARALPGSFPQAAELLVASLGEPLARSEGNGMEPFLFLPHTLYVAEHGLAHFEEAMAAQHALTQRFTCEFSLRPFLVRHPERTLERLAAWTRDPSEHVRRLVSEGTRPRLPWASRLPAFQQDPTPVLALLERLKDDPSAYVRRSVANNLNDIGKDHPARLLETCARWSEGASEERRALIRHALRSAVKKGDAQALAVLGFEGGAALQVEGSLSPRRVQLGGTTRIGLTVRNPGRRAQAVVVDVAVHFVKSNGRSRARVFKGRALQLGAGEAAEVGCTVSFADLTTRRHYPGVHRVEALLNGRPVHVGDLDVRPVRG